MTESEATLNDEINDDEQQLIKLCLKKPKKWNWELTTSKSSSNIAFPRIQLYDEKGLTMLAEASESGFVASSKLRKSASVSKASSLRSAKRRGSLKTKIKPDSIEEIVLDPIISEPEDEIRRKKSQSPVRLCQVMSERGLLVRDANSKEFKKTNEKSRLRPYSRSSSNSMRSRSSVSILERISELKRSSSSEESDGDNEHDEGKDKPKKNYSMRTCNLGTIIVPKESFTNVRRRPKKTDDNSGESNLIFKLNANQFVCKQFNFSLIVVLISIELQFFRRQVDSSAFLNFFFSGRYLCQTFSSSSAKL